MAKTLAGVLAVSIAALLFAGCGGGDDGLSSLRATAAGGSDAKSSEPVINIETWCDFLDATVALYISIESCLIDEDIRKSMPTTQERVDDLSRYYLVRLNVVNMCYLRLGGAYERDSSKVRSCTKSELENLKWALLMEKYGVNDFLELFGALDGVNPAKRDGGYLIDGDIYNDPWGLDYRNDSSDVYGDGR
jgi:hypothetical protein